MTNDDLSDLSGESTYRAPKPLELNEVSLNGDADAVETAPGKLSRKGGYFRKKILIGKPKNEKPEEVRLGGTINVVFLKIRRKLVERGKDGEIVRSTSEHNSPSDAVTLFDARIGDRKNGIAKDIREEFEGLRTVQIVYALLAGGTGQPELVKLIIKGASLGSEVKTEGVLKFYEYLDSFAKSEHIWEYKTVLTPVLEQGKKTYFAIDFKRGEKLSERSLAYAVEKLKDVAAKCADIDAARATRIIKAATTADVAPEAVDEPEATGVDYPKDDINPDDIPF